MTDLEPDRNSLTNGAGLVNGTGLTNGWGMKNGLGMTNSSESVNGSRPTDGLHPFTEGLTNGKRVKESSGLEVKVELINGFSIKSMEVMEDPPRGWSRSARKRQVVRKALLEKSVMPMPGEGEPTAEEPKKEEK